PAAPRPGRRRLLVAEGDRGETHPDGQNKNEQAGTQGHINTPVAGSAWEVGADARRRDLSVTALHRIVNSAPLSNRIRSRLRQPRPERVSCEPAPRQPAAQMGSRVPSEIRMVDTGSIVVTVGLGGGEGCAVASV